MTYIRFKILKTKDDKYSAYSRAHRAFTVADTPEKLWQKLKQEYNVVKHMRRNNIWIAHTESTTTE